MNTRPLPLCAALLLVWGASGCTGAQKLAKMDPMLPIDTRSGFSQHDQRLDGADMLEKLSRERASARYVRRARALSITANILAAAGGALIGWPVGQAIAGAEEPIWPMAYAGAGAVVASISLGIGGIYSVKDAVAAHNRSFPELSSQPRTRVAWKGGALRW
jgi:hypothetical protein